MQVMILVRQLRLLDRTDALTELMERSIKESRMDDKLAAMVALHEAFSKSGTRQLTAVSRESKLFWLVKAEMSKGPILKMLCLMTLVGK